MDLIDDVNPVFSLCRRVLYLFPDVTDVFHTIVGCCIDLYYIHRSSCKNGLAGRTLVTGASIYRMFAVYSPGIDLRYTGLTCTSGSAEQIGMTNTFRRDLVF